MLGVLYAQEPVAPQSDRRIFLAPSGGYKNMLSFYLPDNMENLSSVIFDTTCIFDSSFMIWFNIEMGVDNRLDMRNGEVV